MPGGNGAVNLTAPPAADSRTIRDRPTLPGQSGGPADWGAVSKGRGAGGPCKATENPFRLNFKIFRK